MRQGCRCYPICNMFTGIIILGLSLAGILNLKLFIIGLFIILVSLINNIIQYVRF